MRHDAYPHYQCTIGPFIFQILLDTRHSFLRRLVPKHLCNLVKMQIIQYISTFNFAILSLQLFKAKATILGP
jgi:hypothetical protein